MPPGCGDLPCSRNSNTGLLAEAMRSRGVGDHESTPDLGSIVTGNRLLETL